MKMLSIEHEKFECYSYVQLFLSVVHGGRSFSTVNPDLPEAPVPGKELEQVMAWV